MKIDRRQAIAFVVGAASVYGFWHLYASWVWYEDMDPSTLGTFAKALVELGVGLMFLCAPTIMLPVAFLDTLGIPTDFAFVAAFWGCVAAWLARRLRSKRALQSHDVI